MNLLELATGAPARVVSVSAAGPGPGLGAAGSAGAAGNAGAGPDVGRRLAELGFLPGERLRIVARGLFGREPLAVRIGTGTFALRAFEAACIRVAVEAPPG